MLAPRGRCGCNNKTAIERASENDAMEKIVCLKGDVVVMMLSSARAIGRNTAVLLVEIALRVAVVAGIA